MKPRVYGLQHRTTVNKIYKPAYSSKMKTVNEIRQIERDVYLSDRELYIKFSTQRQVDPSMCYRLVSS